MGPFFILNKRNNILPSSIKNFIREPLEFSAGSHLVETGRELEIRDERKKQILQNLRVTNYKHAIESFNAGEFSFHSGCIFHGAGANISIHIRKMMTVIYKDS